MKSRRPYRKPVGKLEVSDQSIAARKAREYAFKAKASREFQERGAVQRQMPRGWTAILTRSAKTPGRFQVTRFDQDMDPVGDSERSTLKEALDVLYWDTYDTMPTRIPMAKGLSKPAKIATIRFGRKV